MATKVVAQSFHCLFQAFLNLVSSSSIMPLLIIEATRFTNGVAASFGKQNPAQEQEEDALGTAEHHCFGFLNY
jgi:hypothetical protein